MQWRQANNQNFFRSFSIFESGGITKHLMTGPSGNRDSPRGTLRVSGKQNSLFPLWPVIKCLLSLIVDANHLYRYQVQGQCRVSDLKWNDFVLMTDLTLKDQGVHVERIYMAWHGMVPLCQS